MSIKLPRARVAQPIAYVLFLRSRSAFDARDNAQVIAIQTYMRTASKPSSSIIGPQVGVVALIWPKAIRA